MNILLITQIYPEPDDKDGYMPTKTIKYFAREWEKAGHQVVVIHCQTSFPWFYYAIPDALKRYLLRNSYALIPTFSSRKKMSRIDEGVRVYRLPMKKLIPSSAFPEKIIEKQEKEIENILKKILFKPDIVAGHFINPSLELCVRVGKYFNAITSFVFHNDCNQVAIERYRVKKYINSIDIIGCRSLDEAERLSKQLRLKKLPFICYSGVPDEEVRDADKKCDRHNFKGGVKFLYAGGLVKNKNVDKVIKAFQIVKMNNYTLEIIGGGPEKNSLIRLVQDYDLESCVKFTGRRERKEVFHRMKQANIFTMISIGETFGMVYLEAMLQGCIVIASKDGGFDGIIQDGFNGFLCNAGDETMLTNIYKKIISMTIEERNRIGQAAIDTALTFSEKTVADRYLNNIMQGVNSAY